MKKYLVFLFILIGAVGLSFLTSRPAMKTQVTRQNWPAMGTVAGISYRTLSVERAEEIHTCVQETFERLDTLLSSWNPDSELSRVAALPEKKMLSHVSLEVRPCYEKAFYFARISANAFNPYAGGMLKKLEQDARRHTSDFDLGAIAKGFAVDRAYQLLQSGKNAVTNETHALLIDLGGNLRAVMGDWETAIKNPFGTGSVGVFTLHAGETVATSGNYERFVVVDGVRLSHILDGRTGKPISGMAGVTVVHPSSAMLADALSTTLFVLGPQTGSAFLTKYAPEAAALWVPDEPTSPRIIATPNMAARLSRPQWGIDVVSPKE